MYSYPLTDKTSPNPQRDPTQPTISHPYLIIAQLIESDAMKNPDQAHTTIKIATNNLANSGHDLSPFIQRLESNLSDAATYYTYCMSMTICKTIIQNCKKE